MIIIAGSGSTDVPMFDRADITIGVNRPESSVNAHVTSHDQVLDILEFWLQSLKAKTQV